MADSDEIFLAFGPNSFQPEPDEAQAMDRYAVVVDVQYRIRKGAQAEEARLAFEELVSRASRRTGPADAQRRASRGGVPPGPWNSHVRTRHNRRRPGPDHLGTLDRQLMGNWGYPVGAGDWQ